MGSFMTVPESGRGELFEGARPVWIPRAEFTGAMRSAIAGALPDAASWCFNVEGDQVWFQVSRPYDPDLVYRSAVRSMTRPAF
jgi:hypothetical protein